MAEKITIMELKVDLQCLRCYKKVKKLLCKFPQIRDQVYDEKKNMVTITVICCSPEKIRDKLCYKGGKVIKSIEIKPPPKPKPPEKPVMIVEQGPKPGDQPPPKVLNPAPQALKPTPAPLQAAPIISAIPGYGCPSIFPYPFEACCGPCSEGRSGGPCYHGYGRPRPSYDNYGYGPYCDENTSACTIM